MAFGVDRPDTRFSVRVPGGVVLRPTVTTATPSKFELATSMLGQLNSLFAPMRPVLSLIRFSAAVFKFAQALASVLKIPPDLAALRTATDELATAGSDVLAINPATAFAPFVLDLVTVCRRLLDGLDEKVGEIDAVVAQANAIRTAASAPHVTDAARAVMLTAADDLDAVADTLAAAVSDVLEPVDQLFASVNAVGAAFGTRLLPRIGTANDLDGLRAVVESLRAALALLP